MTNTMLKLGLKLIQILGLFLGILLTGGLARAAHPASSCYLDGQNPNAQIEGEQIDLRLPLGSVSKLVTTYWALSVLKPTFRFGTRIYITPIATKDKNHQTVDIHFEGSRDPYIGKESLHYLISELNKRKIFKIRNLTFDDNFKFFWNVGGGPMLTRRHQSVETGYFGPNDPSNTEVGAELRRYKSNLGFGYEKTREYLKKFNIDLIPGAKVSVQTVKYVSASDYHPDDGTFVRLIYSSPLLMLLREMNRTSNNHAANQIFEHLGGAEKFREFIQQDGFTENDILFVNGHGNRKDLPDQTSIYNEASCKTIVTIMSRLRKKLTFLKMDLDEVLPVPGADEKSTLGAYKDSTYADSVAAKTGTVGPAVTLAGMLKTKNGPVYFMFNMSTEGTQKDWSKARKTIASELIALTQKFNGGMPFDTQQVKFLAFDPELFFQADDWKDSSDEGTVTPHPQVPQNPPNDKTSHRSVSVADSPPPSRL
jgi:D-alanyl-D-alanine carboxypeptidase/D-alanyl-D-alanine-endopeptidase (penicillin-binding protein 4)